MKVYTEINYEFKDGSLVQESSKFYQYEGPVEECKSKPGDVYADFKEKATSGKLDPFKQIKQAPAKLKRFKKDANLSFKEGPKGGVWKEIADNYYEGSDLHKGVAHVQKQYRDTTKDFWDKYSDKENDPDADTSGNGSAVNTEKTAEEREAIEQQGLLDEGGRKRKYGRQAMVTGKQASSILDPLL